MCHVCSESQYPWLFWCLLLAILWRFPVEHVQLEKEITVCFCSACMVSTWPKVEMHWVRVNEELSRMLKCPVHSCLYGWGEWSNLKSTNRQITLMFCSFKLIIEGFQQFWNTRRLIIKKYYKKNEYTEANLSLWKFDQWRKVLVLCFMKLCTQIYPNS